MLEVDNTNDRVGIGTTNPEQMLQVGTAVSVYGNSGIVSASKYYGDGSNITGISTGLSVNAAGGALQRLLVCNVTAGVANTAATTGSLYWNDNTSTLYATNVNVSGTTTTEDTQNVDSTGIVTAGLGFRATLGGIVVTAGIITAPSLDISTGGVDIDGQTDLDELVVAGVSSFTAYPAIDADNELQVGTAIQLGKAGIVTALGLDISTGGVDIDGQTDLDEVVIAGVTTASNNVNVSGGTITVGTGITIAAVAGFGTFSKGVKLGKGGLLVEGISSVSAGFDNTSDLNLDDGMIHYTNDALAGNANTLNLTSSVGINTSMALNEMIVVTGITSVSSTSHYVNELTIDNVKARNICWIGGAAPTEGGSTGFDTYVFTVWKAGE